MDQPNKVAAVLHLVEDDPRLELLKQLAADGVGELVPVRSLESSFGHVYPLAQTVLGTRPGQEIELLDELSMLGLLERRFGDRVRVCPSCHHFALSQRQTCPCCDTANIDVVDLIHHYRCGWVAPEREFRDGIRLRCPKCSHDLRHIGVDYERPATTRACVACTHIFDQPRETILCLACGGTFEPELVTERVLYVYGLTPSGSRAAEAGVIPESRGDAAFVHTDLGLYTREFFEVALEREILRARRFEKPLTIGLAEPDSREGIEKRLGQRAAASRFWAVARTVRDGLRECDVPALYGARTIAFMLPDTPLDGAVIAVQRIATRVRELPESDPIPTLSVGLCELSQHASDVSELVARASASLREAKLSGGDRIVPAAA